MSNAPLMLSVSGCRGIVGASLSPSVAAGFAAAFGSFVVSRHKGKSKSRPIVVVGRDGRPGGTMVRDAAIAGLTGAGCDVVDIDIAMTPTVGVMVDHLSAAGGMVFTASHNPQQWNGLKCLIRDTDAKKSAVSAAAPDKATADQIINIYKSNSATLAQWDNIGVVCHSAGDATKIHCKKVDAVVNALKARAAIKKAKFKIVLDCVNGAGATIAPAYLRSLGCTVEVHGDEPGQPFPHTPEPLAENLTSLSKAVKKSKAAVGFAQDPDADRLALVDENGRFIGEEYTLVLATRALFELGGVKKNSSTAVNMSTSRMIDDLCASFGARSLRSAVGEANVVEVMKKNKCIIGGEGNGGVIYPAITYIRDSLGAMALVLALMARSKKSLSQLVSEIPSYAIVKQKVELARKEDANPACAKIAAAYRDQSVNTIDGVRIDWSTYGEQNGRAPQPSGGAAWLHVRASNTEPIMRLIAEAPTPDLAQRILSDAAAVIAG
ncbi:MAG: phosphoglucosamine mutase [Planctomycetes bacterium]|nr:phosphoglucosamine mutase [Planctomycetota bacterium]